MTQRIGFSLAIAMSIASCAGQTPAPQVAHAPLPSAPVATFTGLSAPASVLYDATEDRYLVSNVNGRPLDQDNNGYISVLAPDGKAIALNWIQGGKNGVTLNAPKGLAIADGVLYVADISVVRTFDAKTGAARSVIPVPGETWLKDVAAGSHGSVYVSDAGGPTGRFDGKGTEAVYEISNAKVRVLAKGALGRPDGIAWTDDGLIVCPFGASEIYRLDEHGAKRDVTATPAGGLSGIVHLPDGSLLVTSWQSSSVLRGKLGGPFEVALADQTSPADIGFDSKRSRLLVPHFAEGTIDAFEVR